MRPTCLYLNKKGTQSDLYVAEISTREALEVFVHAEPVKIAEFEASRGNGWISKGDLPSSLTVGELINYLNSNHDIKLIDFTGIVGGNATLSTHDNMEASFLVASEEHAIGIMHSLLDKDLFPVILPAMLENQGKYIALVNSEIKVFATFEDWIAGTPAPH